MAAKPRRVRRALSCEVLRTLSLTDPCRVHWNGRTWDSPEQLLSKTVAAPLPVQVSAALAAFQALALENRSELCRSDDHMVIWQSQVCRPLIGVNRGMSLRAQAEVENLGGRTLVAMRSALRDDPPDRTVRLGVHSVTLRWMLHRTWVVEEAIPTVLHQLAESRELKAVLTGVVDEVEERVATVAKGQGTALWAYHHTSHTTRRPEAFQPSLADVSVPLAPVPRFVDDEQVFRDSASRAALKDCDSILAVTGPQRLGHTHRAIEYGLRTGKPVIVIDGMNRRVHQHWPEGRSPLRRALAPVA